MSIKYELFWLLSSIPKGKVTTYKILAEYFHTSPRAIASMLSANRELDRYPCYKVIACNGKISGYRGWIENKIIRLESDGVKIQDKKIDLSLFLWLPEWEKA